MTALKKIIDTLSEIGLTRSEIDAYLEILKIGNMPTSGVARRLNVNRSTVRYTLESLVKKRFAIKTEKNGTFYYTAKEPDKIISVLQKKQSDLKKQENAVGQILGDLKNLKSPNSNLPKVRFFEGVDGLIEMYRDILTECKSSKCTIYGCASFDQTYIPQKFLNFMKNEYIPARQKIGNKAFSIFNERDRQSLYLKQDSTVNRTSLFVPEDKFPLKTSFQIYNGKIAFSSQQSDSNISGTIIEHVDIHDDQFSFFKMAWELAKTLPINEKHQNINLC